MPNYVHFLSGLASETEEHYNYKEYRLDVIVEIEGKYFETYFFTQSAITYEMTTDGYFSFPGMIVLDEISYDKIMIAIKALIKYEYFKCYSGYTELPKNSRFMHRWYLNDLTHDYKDMESVEL
jgi:hypothetical protein